MTDVYGFIISYGEHVNELITEARVSASWNPNSNRAAPTMHQCNALWDTGATMSAISERIATSLQLIPEGKATASLAHGQAKDLPVYYVNIVLPNEVMLTGMSVAGMDLPSTDLLIGMDVIKEGDLAISNWQGKTTLTFRIPSVETLDFSSMGAP